jgi:zinc/manganese transport system permease protein
MQFISIMGLPLLGCFLMAAVLSFLGLHILKREIVFIDIALAQIIAVASISSHIFFGAHGDSAAGLLLTGVSIVAAAFFFSIVHYKHIGLSLEAVIGVSYAIAAAAALFIVGIAPGGHIHVQHILSGSILWISIPDIRGLVMVFAAAGVLFYMFKKPLTAASTDGCALPRGGRGLFWWDFMFYLLAGIVIAASVRQCGVVLVFSFLIIPATASALFSSSWIVRYLTACALGCGASLCGLGFADLYDFSAGPSVAFFMGALLIVCIIIAKTVRRNRPAE